MAHGSFLSSDARAAKAVWWVLFAAAVVWYGVFRVAQPVQSEPFTGSFNGNDFKHFYLGSYMLVHGQDPYDAEALLRLARGRGLGAINPYVYLPFTGLVMSPLTLLDPPDAMRLWFVLNQLFLFAALALAFWSLRIRPSPMNLATGMTLVALCYPLHRTLTAGQLNCALLFLFALVFALERKGWYVAAGAAAAFAFLFKIFPGILLGYFAWRVARHVRNAHATDGANDAIKSTVSMVVFSGVLLLISIIWVGWDQHLAFRPLLAQMSYGHSTWAELGQQFYRDPANQSFNSFFHHIVAPLSGSQILSWLALGPEWANRFTQLAVGLCGLLALTSLAGALRKQNAVSLSYSIFILLGLLIPSIYWDHYAVIALWPLLAIYAIIPEQARPGAYGLMVLLTLVLGAFWELPVFWTGMMMGAALFIFVLLAWRYRGHGYTAALWSIASAVILARFAFDHPAFREGAGLLAMSVKLWGTLLVLALCLGLLKPLKDV